MQVGGLASGMDIDEMVDKLMAAERKPMEKMEQDKTELEWKRDAFRDVNKSLLELDNKMSEMKDGNTYNSKSVSSSSEDVVTGSASSDALNGTYTFDVKELASPTVHVSKKMGKVEDGLKPDKPLEDVSDIKFTTFSAEDDDDESETNHKVNIDNGDSLNDVLKNINKEEDVKAFYDESLDKVIMETTNDGVGIKFDDDSFLDFSEKGGNKAEFTYNGLDEKDAIKSNSNYYEINGMEATFKDEGKATLQVENDTDETVDKITSFIDTYNDVVEKLNETQKEDKDREYPPLTDEQKDEMSEDEIEKWEEKAKSGILRGESSISSGLSDMRNSWYSKVDTGGDITSLTQIGITTSKNYLDGGKLEIDEDKLTKAVQENPGEVEKLFTNDTEDEDSRGLIYQLEDALNATTQEIKSTAGGEDSVLETYTLGKEIKNQDTRISDFEDRLEKTEERYWNQFTEMEKSIQQMNDQSEQMMSQLGGGGDMAI